LRLAEQRVAWDRAMSTPYGRPFRRRKAASICGKPILRPQDGTLHHDPPVADGGNTFSERPAHETARLAWRQARRRAQRKEPPVKRGAAAAKVLAGCDRP
jgi:hypothetical protein